MTWAHLEAAYPGVYYRPGFWPTTDGVIPWKAAALLHRMKYPLAAEGILEQVHAIRYGLAMKDPQQYDRHLLAQAYPTLNGDHGQRH